MNTHQTKDRQYCRAIKINKPSDHPGIVVDPSGFEGAKIQAHGPGGTGWRDVPRGGFVLERDGVVVGVLSEGEFFRMWEPIPPKPEPGPATRAVIDALKATLMDMQPGECIWFNNEKYDECCTQNQIREFIREQEASNDGL